MRRIAWVAVAEARGHLMRAHLARRALATRGIAVDVLTTSQAGHAFLAALGTPSEVVTEHFAVVYDERHNLRAATTQRRMLRYLCDPRRAARDVFRIEDAAAGADLVVNDAMHPALLVAPALSRQLARRLIHVHGANVRAGVEDNLRGRGGLRWVLGRSLARAHAQVEIRLDAPLRGTRDGNGVIGLPPLLAAPSRSAAEVRAALGVVPGQRLVVAYCNPHFRDPALAAAIERAADRAGAYLHAIGEGYADRPRWSARDPRLIDAIAAGDVLIAGPGMATVSHAAVLGLRYVALVSDHPEQRRNAAEARALVSGLATIDVTSGNIDVRLDAALSGDRDGRTGQPDNRTGQPGQPDIEARTRAIAAIATAWADTFADLCAETAVAARAA